MLQESGVGWFDPGCEEGQLVEVGWCIMMTDPIADLLTRIRNGVQVERPFVCLVQKLR